MNVLFAPHNDDEALFASFLCLRHKPLVIVCLRSELQEIRGDGITNFQREAETNCAMEILECDWIQWSFSDAAPDWATMRTWMDGMADDMEMAFAPAYEEGGHAQHNAIAQMAAEAFRTRRLTQYLTYTKEGKSKWGTPVPYETEWVASKLAAVSCYRSQIAHPLQAEHFVRSFREYVA